MKKQIDLQKKMTQIMNVMMNFRWYTLKCPQVVHFQVPDDKTITPVPISFTPSRMEPTTLSESVTGCTHYSSIK